MGDVPDDVSAFLAARWAGLVALAEDLGAPPGLAVEVATDAADRVAQRWRRVRDKADPAAVAALLVVEAWDDVRRTP